MGLVGGDFDEWMSVSVTDWATMSACIDRSDTYSSSAGITFATTMYSITGNPNIQTCSDALSYCDGPIPDVRLTCPVTCGCDSPISGQVHMWDVDGCPHSKCAFSENYQRVLAELPCSDWNSEELGSSAGWNRLLVSALARMKLEGIYTESFISELHADAKANGCQSQILQRSDLPLLFQFLMVPFCPLTLGCTTWARWNVRFPQASLWCPQKCKFLLPAQNTSPTR
eukprot:gnl/TRDRNA2_/TRDRNA2_142790_c1_seq1.p1 gnl/TRDRNA2_/TRDRNA2_142790_c1~~gnl/TRDRNA2_/TRDRNA2_142790_c1_seq1.p1  ORF type:complete len:263 (-),score=19.65 gnl/TRDRNA2_/TRDRNA2_142790_c1_seq1:122-802(-)